MSVTLWRAPGRGFMRRGRNSLSGRICNATNNLANHVAGKVFFNLLDNSARHGGNVSSVKLSCHCEGDTLKIVYKR